ncbi:MAG: C40 family peptidase [Bordetella sp.]|uniref:C40 family peptidase n=1 Tax=Bordetella sp. TaxID=28081 RepID=UPI003F7C3995
MQATRNANRLALTPAAWLRRALAVAALAALAGCAGMNGNSDAMIDAEEMAAHSDDPIGALIAAQYTRDALHGHSHHPILSEALEQLGTPYRYGGDSPATGFDCSGLIQYAAKHSIGMTLPRNAAEQAAFGIPIARSELRPGDLVFFNTMGARYSHVGIYLGADRFVDAPSTGGVVRIDDMTVSYWNSRYSGARRIPMRVAYNNTRLRTSQR